MAKKKSVWQMSYEHHRKMGYNAADARRLSGLGSHKSYKKKKNGCYIATCVYGSYDCPQVWVLRRYRDFYLRERFLGRLFIRLYYTFSPVVIKLFGNTSSFKQLFSRILNKKIEKLTTLGYSSEPYTDK